MFPENIPHTPENQKPLQKTTIQKPPQKCPRCNSSNTKFCYYNNYNLSQPRHFCKTCRRFWTHGGVLRNVPIGGRVRKPGHRKLKPNLITITCGNCEGTSLASGADEVGFELHPATAGVYSHFVNASGPGPFFGLDLLRMNSDLINNNSTSLFTSFIHEPSFNIIKKENNSNDDNNNNMEKMGNGEINLFDNLHGVWSDLFKSF